MTPIHLAKRVFFAVPLAILFLTAQLLLGGHFHASDAAHKSPVEHCAICLVKTVHNDGAAPLPTTTPLAVPSWQRAPNGAVPDAAQPASFHTSENWARGPPTAA